MTTQNVIDNMQTKARDESSQSINNSDFEQIHLNLEDINDLQVDMTYQRRMRLRKLLKKLLDKGEFDKDAAGFIDVAIRTDKSKVVWDGFRRVIMAALTGLTRIPCSITKHAEHISLSEQPKIEARLFKIRNTPEKISPEETFKADVVYEDETAIKIKTLLEANSTNGITYTFTYNEITNQITITNSNINIITDFDFTTAKSRMVYV